MQSDNVFARQGQNAYAGLDNGQKCLRSKQSQRAYPLRLHAGSGAMG